MFNEQRNLIKSQVLINSFETVSHLIQLISRISKMDTRIVVTTFTCGHTLVYEEDMPPSSIWKGIKRNVTSQVMHDIKYENSYHDCSECEPKRMAALKEQPRSPFLFLLPEPTGSTVQEQTEQSKPKFLFNVETPEVNPESSNEYSSYSTEYTGDQEMDFTPQPSENRDVLQGQSFGNDLPSGMPTQYEYPDPEELDSDRVTNSEEIEETIPDDTSDESSISSVSTSSSYSPDTTLLVDPYSRVGLNILRRSRIYLSTPPNLPARKILDFGTAQLVDAFSSRYQRCPPKWGVIAGDGKKYRIRSSRADLKLRTTVINDMRSINWGIFEAERGYETDSSADEDGSDGSCAEFTVESDDDRRKRRKVSKDFYGSLLVPKDTKPTLNERAQPHFPHEKGSSGLRREWKVFNRRPL